MEEHSVPIKYSHREKNQEKYDVLERSDSSFANVLSAVRNQFLFRGLLSIPKLSRTQSGRESKGI